VNFRDEIPAGLLHFRGGLAAGEDLSSSDSIVRSTDRLSWEREMLRLSAPRRVVWLARNWFERIFVALTDDARSERTMVLLLAGYAAAWSLYASIAKSSQDIHPDMGEMVAWSREVGLGTPKHPPLAPWLVGPWFRVFPREDWAYYLFAMILPTVALWIAWRISARYLPSDKRVVGIAMLTLVPFYNFHALKFNANTVLTPFWAATTWWFLRSFETRRLGWAALAGVGAAATMLGKYWSLILLAGLGITALTDSRRDPYFGSSAPYVTLAVGTILLTPHIDWMIAHHFVTITYATEAHPATSLTAARSAIDFIAGSLCYIAAPIVLSVLAAQPNAAVVRDTLWPVDPDRRRLIVAFAAPFLFAALIAVLLRVEIVPLWAISAMTLLPVVLLSSPLVTISRLAAVRLMALAIVFPLVMIAISPVVATVGRGDSVANHESQYRLIAQAVERAWYAYTAKPLRVVGSIDSLVNGTAFYFVDEPLTFDILNPTGTPWIDGERIERDGIAIVCPESDFFCMQATTYYLAYYRPNDAEDVVIARRHFGTYDKPTPYKIVIIPPKSTHPEQRNPPDKTQ
jgi:4-amino-4-deoxy-L-arabinose transferase-like glycosyltransferase